MAELFQDQNIIAFPQTLAPAKRFPIIGNRIFGTLKEAQAYVDEIVRGTAVPGIILSVIADGDNNGAYWVSRAAGYNGESKGVLIKLSIGSGNSSTIVIDTVMSDMSNNPVANRVVKAYADLRPRYKVVESISAPTLPDGNTPESGGGSINGGSIVVKNTEIRVRCIDGILCIFSKSDLSQADIQLGRLGRSNSRVRDAQLEPSEPRKKNGWRIYKYNDYNRSTALKNISLEQEIEKYDGMFKYEVVFISRDGFRSSAAAYALCYCFGERTEEGGFRLKNGHSTVEVKPYAVNESFVQASQTFALVINGVFYPFRMTVCNSGSSHVDELLFGLTPL